MGFKTQVTSPRWWSKGHWPRPPTKTNNYIPTQEQKQFWGSFQNRQQHSETKSLESSHKKGRKWGSWCLYRRSPGCPAQHQLGACPSPGAPGADSFPASGAPHGGFTARSPALLRHMRWLDGSEQGRDTGDQLLRGRPVSGPEQATKPSVLWESQPGKKEGRKTITKATRSLARIP